MKMITNEEEITGEVSMLSYHLKQIEKREAYANYNHAGAKFKLAQIEERAAEVECQYEPLNSLNFTRDDIVALVKYVVYGRMIDG